ncbi:surface antigen variable number repeat family protein [Bordetella holmesii ATCC 51541]|nr:surface antigen variable number repeat family protein [Bordetella holmesii ATCC 51541]
MQAYASRPEIIIDPGGVTPQALTVITEAVDAIARLAEDQDGGEITRLRRRARDATVAALATQGYFTAQVTLAPGTDVGGDTWDISIQAGPRAVIRSVDLNFTGRVLRPEYAARVEQWRQAWSLKPGQPFINGDWNKAKAHLLDSVSSRDFLLATMTESQAEVQADTAEVALSVTIDSGPLVRLGQLQTQGLKRVPESLITRYVRYSEGEPYNQDQLDDWQQELQSTAFFRGRSCRCAARAASFPMRRSATRLMVTSRRARRARAAWPPSSPRVMPRSRARPAPRLRRSTTRMAR